MLDLDELTVIMIRAASDCYRIIDTYPIQNSEDGEKYLSRIMKEKTFKVSDKAYNITFAHRLALTMFLEVDENTVKVKNTIYYPHMRLLSDAINLSNIKDYLIKDWWENTNKEEG